ncbi:MAG: LytTR family DNA-binding domain-containing protein [Cyclobacteriaceae bacterium]
MDLVNALIFEDEPLAADRLINLIEKEDEKINVLAVIDSVSEGIQFLENNPLPDLVFMDIELSDGKCFELFEFFKLEVPIIFTTAYDEYPLEAFKHNCLDYLLKPVKPKELARSIDKFKKIFKPKKASKTSNYKSHFLGKVGTKLFHKKVEEISLIFSEDKITYIVDQSHKRYIIDYTLEELESQLLDSKLFYRISRKHIVNLNAITIVKTYINQRLSLELDINIDHPIIVSREKVADFKNWLDR